MLKQRWLKGCFTKQYRLELFERKWLPYLKKLPKPIPLSLGYVGANVLSLLTDDALIAQVSILQNFFPLSLTMRPNKLEGFSLETLSCQVLEFEGKALANPIGAPSRCSLLGQAPGATSKC
jgi:hypothetical protein